jgi:hypothetical protein
LEKPDLKAADAADHRQRPARAWSEYIVSSILYGNAKPDAEREYHDGDMDDDEDEGGKEALNYDYDGIIGDLAGGVGVGVDYGNGEEGWRDVKVEMVECEVPVGVFPGNTVFKALDVVFDV